MMFSKSLRPLVELPSTKMTQGNVPALAGLTQCCYGLRPLFYAAVTLAFVFSAMAAPASLAQTKSRVQLNVNHKAEATYLKVNLLSQPLGKALGEYSLQTGIAVFAPAALLRGKTSQRVQGTMLPEQAIALLLQDTGLEAELDHRQESPVYRITVKDGGNTRALKRVSIIPSTPSIEEVTVRGFWSRSLKGALNTKRAADTIVETIFAPEMGRLPSVNVAEALQRVPGVAITRESGEGQFVTVRGLGPNFQTVTLNGFPVAYNENIRTSGQSGRQFRFRVLPSDLIDRIDVLKSSSADVIEGGTGSVINLESINPLERDSFIGGRLFANYRDKPDTVKPNGSLSGSWRNTDTTLGIMGGLSLQNRNVLFERFQSFGYDALPLESLSSPLDNLSPINSSADIGNKVYVSRDYSTTVEQESIQHGSFLGGIQWQISERWQWDLDGLYTLFQNDIVEDRVRYGFGHHVQTERVPGSIRVNNGVLTAATIQGGRIERNAEFSEQSHNNTAINTKLIYATDDWTLTPKLSYSKAVSHLDTPLQRINAWLENDKSITYRIDLGKNAARQRRVHTLTTSLDLTAPLAVPFQRYRIRPIASKDKDMTAAFDVERHLQAVSIAGLELTAAKAGMLYSERLRDYDRRDRKLLPREGVTLNDHFFDRQLSADIFDDITHNQQTWVGPDLNDFAKAFVVENEFDGARPQISDLAPTPSDLRQSYAVGEDIYAAYIRLDITSQNKGMPITGNLGLRWVDTATVVEGAAIDSAMHGGNGIIQNSEANGLIATPRITSSAYTKWLPSLNLKLTLTDNVILRLAASRTLTRPSLADLRDATIPDSGTLAAIFEQGAQAVNNPSLVFSGSGGNPRLAPYLAHNFDVSMEWYFHLLGPRLGLLSVSAFHKSIQDYIATDERMETLLLATSTGASIPVGFSISRPNNIGDVNVSGLELGFSHQWSNGLGLSAAVTVVSSDITLAMSGDSPAADIQGVSDLNYTITPFFEHPYFEAHLSWSFRSDYVSNFAGEVQATPATGIVAVADDFGTLDFGFAYHVTDAIDVFTEGVNLTNEKQVTFFDNRQRLAQIQHYGRTLNIGVRAQF